MACTEEEKPNDPKRNIRFKYTQWQFKAGVRLFGRNICKEKSMLMIDDLKTKSRYINHIVYQVLLMNRWS